MLNTHNLRVVVDGKQIVNGISLTIKPGEIHALMGPNGSGKSSLAMAIVGHPAYKLKTQISNLKSGNNKHNLTSSIIHHLSSINLDGIDISDKTPDERARMGLFLAMQYPMGIGGVTVEQLLRRSLQEKTIDSDNQQSYIDPLQFRKDLEKLAKKVGVKPELLRRSINVGFSGGEKKRLEVLQMLVLQPKYAILDETDSGLDIDALKKVAEMVKTAKWSNGYKPGILVITHYARLLHYMRPDYVHIMKGGKIVDSGDGRLAERIEKVGYEI